MARVSKDGRATMDFFQAQADARRRTRLLLLAFGVAVLLVIASYCLIAVLAYAVLALFTGGGLPPPRGRCAAPPADRAP